MKKIYSKVQLKELKEYPIEAVKIICEIIEILDENYGADRDMYKDLGGYILIAENIVDIEVVKQGKLQDLIPKYTDIIECSEGVNWTSSLFLCAQHGKQLDGESPLWAW